MLINNTCRTIVVEKEVVVIIEKFLMTIDWEIVVISLDNTYNDDIIANHP